MDINLLRVLCSWGSVFTCLDIYSESGGAARWEPAEVELCSGEKRNQCLSNQVRMCVNEWEGDQFNSKYENNRGCEGGHTEGTLKENAWIRKWNSIWGSCFISVRQVCDTLTKFHELRELSGVAIVSIGCIVCCPDKWLSLRWPFSGVQRSFPLISVWTYSDLYAKQAFWTKSTINKVNRSCSVCSDWRKE